MSRDSFTSLFTLYMSVDNLESAECPLNVQTACRLEIICFTGLGGDYMENFQPGLSFSQINRAEIVLRLHSNIQSGVTQNCSSSEAKIFARAETIKSRNEAILVYLTNKNLFLSFLKTVENNRTGI